GIYIGTGDQNNYFKIALFANFGNPGIQLLREENGQVVVDDVIPVPGILSAEEVDILIDVAPAAGTLSFRYQRNNDATPLPVGAASYNVSGNLLNVLQNTPAMALGVIASSGAAPAYSAKWDFIRITHPGPYVLKAFPDQ